MQLFSKKILEHEITDIIQEIQYIQKQISILKSKIINISTIDFFTQLYNRQLPTFNKIAYKTFTMLNNKLENWIQNLAFNINNYNIGSHNLTTKILQTKNFIRKNNDLIILNADKSNKTVIMNKIDYNSKIYNLLSDNSTYIKLDKDPTNEINLQLKSILLLWKSKKIINDNTFKFLHSNTCTAPKFYGFPKLHKPNCPLRPITSFINSPTYNLSKCISKSLQKTVGLNEFYIKDSWNFKNKHLLINEYHNYCEKLNL